MECTVEKIFHKTRYAIFASFAWRHNNNKFEAIILISGRGLIIRPEQTNSYKRDIDIHITCKDTIDDIVEGTILQCKTH